MKAYDKDEYDYHALVEEISDMLDHSIKPTKPTGLRLSTGQKIITHIPLKYSDLLNEYKKLKKIKGTRQLITHETELIEKTGLSKELPKETEETVSPGIPKTPAGLEGVETVEELKHKPKEVEKEEIRPKSEIAEEQREKLIVPERSLDEEISVSDLLAKIRERKKEKKIARAKKALSYEEELQKLSWINTLDDDKILTYAQEHLPNTYNMFLQGVIDERMFRSRVKYRMALDEGVSEVTAAKYFGG